MNCGTSFIQWSQVFFPFLGCRALALGSISSLSCGWPFSCHGALQQGCQCVWISDGLQLEGAQCICNITCLRPSCETAAAFHLQLLGSSLMKSLCLHRWSMPLDSRGINSVILLTSLLFSSLLFTSWPLQASAVGNERNCVSWPSTQCTDCLGSPSLC